jgi:hypothetical protein
MYLQAAALSSKDSLLNCKQASFERRPLGACWFCKGAGVSVKYFLETDR